MDGSLAYTSTFLRYHSNLQWKPCEACRDNTNQLIFQGYWPEAMPSRCRGLLILELWQTNIAYDRVTWSWTPHLHSFYACRAHYVDCINYPLVQILGDQKQLDHQKTASNYHGWWAPAIWNDYSGFLACWSEYLHLALCCSRKYPYLLHGLLFGLNPLHLQKFQFSFILSFQHFGFF